MLCDQGVESDDSYERHDLAWVQLSAVWPGVWRWGQLRYGLGTAACRVPRELRVGTIVVQAQYNCLLCGQGVVSEASYGWRGTEMRTPLYCVTRGWKWGQLWMSWYGLGTEWGQLCKSNYETGNLCLLCDQGPFSISVLELPEATTDPISFSANTV